MYINIILFLQFTVFDKKEMKLIAVLVLVVIGLAVTSMFLCSSYSCVVWNSPASFPLVICSCCSILFQMTHSDLVILALIQALTSCDWFAARNKNSNVNKGVKAAGNVGAENAASL